MVSPRKRILADRPRPVRRQGASKLGAVKLRPQCDPASGADCSEQPGDPKVSTQPHRPAHMHNAHERDRQDHSADQGQAPCPSACAPAAKAAADVEFADWGSSSFGFEPPAPSRPGAWSTVQPARQLPQPDARAGSGQARPNLLSPLQRGFKALIDGEAYVSERERAANKGLGIDEPPSSPEPSLLDKGLDAFNAVSRAAVGVATSLDTHIEQLMEQHGWADGVARGPDGGRRGTDSALLGSDASLFELPGFSGGTSLFSGAATAVLSGDEAARRPQGPSDSSTRGGSGGRKQSPNVAEKAAAHVAALLPGFRPKETVNEFLSEVQQVLGGGLLSLESMNSNHRQGSGSMGSLQLDLPEWGTDSGVFSSLANSVSSSRGPQDAADAAAAAEVAAHAAWLQAEWKQQRQQQEAAAPGVSQLAVSPTADKENQGCRAQGGVQRKGQSPAGIDWQDFLSGDSQVLRPAGSSRAASVSSGLSRQASAQPLQGGCLSPCPPATPQQQGEAGGATGQQEDEAAPAGAGTPEAAVTAPDDGTPAQPSAQEPSGSPAVPETPAAKAADPAVPGQDGQQVQLASQTGGSEAIPGSSSICNSPARPSTPRTVPPPLSPGADPIAEQVRVQLEALVAEKSALAQENARLHRENTNLQELLSYTMQRRHTGSGSGVGSDDEDALSDWSTLEQGAAACPSIDNGVSPVKMARRRLSMSDVEDEGSPPCVTEVNTHAQGAGGQPAVDQSIPDISSV